MTDPFFWKYWGPIKKCCRSRCQLVTFSPKVMRLRQPGMQAPEAVPRFGGPAVPTALVPMVTWFDHQTFRVFTIESWLVNGDP